MRYLHHVVGLRPLQHGIEFGYVGGDPAELMRICVENGTFTVAFLKEGVQKVSCISFMLVHDRAVDI